METEQCLRPLLSAASSPSFADLWNTSQPMGCGMAGSLLMFGLFISTFQLGSCWSRYPMTDETVGPDLPAATGGRTNGRTRGGCSIRSQLLRPGRMLRVERGSGQGGAIPSAGESPLLRPWE